MAFTSACAVGSLFCVTWLTPVAMIRLFFVIIAPKGPPPFCMFCVASCIAFCMKRFLLSMLFVIVVFVVLFC